MSAENRIHDPLIGSEPGLPGAFPDTPIEESGPRRNKLRKRNDPRGWSNSRKQPPRGHGHTDSGVGLEPGHELAHNFPENDRVEPVTTKSFDQPKAQSRKKAHENEVSKPGFMTGAYSRIRHSINGRRAAKPDNNPPDESPNTIPSSTDNTETHMDTSAAPTDDTRKNDEPDKIKGSDGPAAVAGKAAAAAGTDGREAPGAQSEESQRNIVNGRDRPDVEHVEPYWGDMSRGTGGVQNTVAGARSEEEAPAPRVYSLHPTSPPKSPTRDGAPTASEGPLTKGPESPTGKGVHNGVIGSGSNEDKSTVKHPRAFPLMSPNHKPTTTREDVPPQTTRGRGSNFNENIFRASASGTPVSYALRKQKTSRYEVAEIPPYSPKRVADIPKPEQENRQHHLGHDAQKYAARDEGEPKSPTDYGDIYETRNPYAHEDISPTAQTPKPNIASTSNNDSHLGRNAALTGAGVAGAGAATYGVQWYADRDGNGRRRSSILQEDRRRRASSVSSAPGSRRGSTVQMHAERLRAQQDPDPSRGGTYNVLADGTPSGVNLANRRRSSATANAEAGPSGSAIADLRKSSLSKASSDAVRDTDYEQGQSHSAAKAAAVGAAGASAGLVAHNAYTGRDNNTSSRSGAPGITIPSQEGGGYVSGEDVSPTSSPRMSRRTDPVPGNVSSSNTATLRDGDKHGSSHDNDTAKIAAAGVGAGAAGVAAHHAWNQHSDDDGDHSKQYKTLSDGTPSGVKLDNPTSTEPVSTQTRSLEQNLTAPRKLSFSTKNGDTVAPGGGHTGTKAAAAAGAATGAGAIGAGVYAANKSTPAPASSHPEAHAQNTTTTTTTTPPAPPSRDTRRRASSQGSIQYKILASGTPSGIAIAREPSPPPTSSTTTTAAPSAMRKSSLSNGSSSGAIRKSSLSNGSGSGGGKKKTARFSDDDLPSSAAATAAAAAGGSKKPVMHKCSHCGREDDVSGYLGGQ